jgi:hypothetical protein
MKSTGCRSEFDLRPPEYEPGVLTTVTVPQ